MDDEQKPKYEKFVVMSIKGKTEKSVPWTGIDQTLNYVKEQLEEGCTVQIKPFTRDKWKEWTGMNDYPGIQDMFKGNGGC